MFADDLERGHLTEKYVADIYEGKYGIRPEMAPLGIFTPWDFRVHLGSIDPLQTWLKVEVKHDEIATEKCRRNKDLFGTSVLFELFYGEKKSGLAATEADQWAHVIDDVVHVFLVEDLRRQARYAWKDGHEIKRNCGDNGKVTGWLTTYGAIRRMELWQRELDGKLPDRNFY